MARRVETALADLEARLRRAEAPILAGLRAGLTRDQVTRLLAEAQLKPDPGLVALYTWHNGAEGGGPQAEFMGIARFLSLQQAIETRKFELGLAAEVFDSDWFPILDDQSGRIYVIEDLGAGRVLIFDREFIGVREELSSSLVAFLDSLVRDGLDFKPSPLTSEVAGLVARLESSDEKERVMATRDSLESVRRQHSSRWWRCSTARMLRAAAMPPLSSDCSTIAARSRS